MQLENADSTVLYEPMVQKLRTQSSEQVFSWLAPILLNQRPALRSSNVTLVAYTGHRAGLEWLDQHVCSPVTTHWGEAAALLEVSWARIKSWLVKGGGHQLMGLDALLAYRLPAPNMAPLHQIAAPVLLGAPDPYELESVLASALAGKDTPRIRNAVSGIQKCREEILAPRMRRVPVEDLGKLFMEPEAFTGADPILKLHEEMRGAVKESINAILDGDSGVTKH